MDNIALKTNQRKYFPAWSFLRRWFGTKSSVRSTLGLELKVLTVISSWLAERSLGIVIKLVYC